ncbi:IS200/IS605 family transposase [Algoriphagus aquimarinus]|uniref:IS200/IS605 family transposase n=1 Tax=Algoriphagus aquimarinus TaxID=237018 RepID=UPI0030DC1981
MSEQRSNGHTVSRLTVHIVWCTKYRYSVLKGDIKMRCRTLLIQICESEDVRILKGVVSKDHIHMHLEYGPSQSVSSLVKRLKGRSSRKLQQEFPDLKKRYWGRHFWAIGFGCWSTGNITDEMVNEYLEHHRRPKDDNNDNFIIE